MFFANRGRSMATGNKCNSLFQILRVLSIISFRFFRLVGVSTFGGDGRVLFAERREYVNHRKILPTEIRDTHLLLNVEGNANHILFLLFVCLFVVVCICLVGKGRMYIVKRVDSGVGVCSR